MAENRTRHVGGQLKGVFHMLCGAISPLLGTIHKLQKSPMNGGGKYPGQGSADWESTLWPFLFQVHSEAQGSVRLTDCKDSPALRVHLI